MIYRTNLQATRLRSPAFQALILVAVFFGLTALPVKSAVPKETIEKFGEYHAIVIGINRYAGWWEPLDYAEQDARDLKKILTGLYGFKVTSIYGADATRNKILKTIRGKVTALGENDNLLIFYAGHGVTNPITEEGFWIPAEAADSIDEESWISFSNVRTLVEAKNGDVKRIALITDSCYGGALTERPVVKSGRLSPDDDAQIYQEWLLKSAEKKSRLIIASGGLEEVPDQSEFTDALKATLEENTLDLIDLYHVFSKILQNSYFQDQEQMPRIETLMAHKKGMPAQFVLIRRE